MPALKLKAVLGSRPVIYEIVPPRKDTSRFETDLRGVEEVLHDQRIDAVNIPELINRRETRIGVTYSPVTILAEEYALLIQKYKEPIVNMIAPRMGREEFDQRVQRVTGEYGIDNLVIVGKERHDDGLPGPTVSEALEVVREHRREGTTVGGVCIFERNGKVDSSYQTKSPKLDEPERVWIKASLGCDFVTSQINFEPGPAIRFLSTYDKLCRKTGVKPLTVFISLTTVPSTRIMSLLEGLDVRIAPSTKKNIEQSVDMGRESLKVAAEALRRIVTEVEKNDVEVPIGLHVEQVGVNNSELSMELLEATYGVIKRG